MTYQRELTKRQQEILDFIRGEVHRCGYPPSVREIGHAVGLSSSSTVHSHLAALEAKGFIRRDPSKPRALEVLDFRENDRGIDYGKVSVVPLVGQVAAGSPILAAENIESTMSLPAELAGDNTFILKVRGESMIEAGILDGDTIILRKCADANNGDIVVALVDEEEATLKRLRRRGDSIALEAANPAYETRIFGPDRVRVQGRLVGLLRRY
jgi:repressor LexA